MGLTEELALLIDEWMAWRNGASLKMLASITGIHYNTVRAYAQREVDSPSFKNVASLITVLLPKSKFSVRGKEFMLRHFPDMQDFVFMMSEHDIQPLQEITSLETFTKDDFLTITLSATKDGLSAGLAIDKMGRERALDSISKLENARIIVKDENRYRIGQMFQILGSERVLQQITWLAEMFDHKLLDKHGSFYRLMTEGLSEDALYQIQKLLCNVSEEITAIVKNPANHGPHVMGYGIISTFLDTPYKDSTP